MIKRVTDHCGAGQRKFLVAILFAACAVAASGAREPGLGELHREFEQTVSPFLRTYCLDCHGPEEPESELNLSVFQSPRDVALGHKTWELVLARLEAKEMPPEDADQPDAPKRRAVAQWIRAFRQQEASRNAGDPGPVPVRRLSNAEYNYSIRDLTGVDIRPTDTFPIDPANEAGFDNSAESLAMSPALLNKYLGAARQVVEHLVLKPEGFSFAPHPVVTNTDRDKYCVKRIVQFYQRQPTDYAEYFLAAWSIKAWNIKTGDVGGEGTSLADFASSHGVSRKYLATIWSTLTEAEEQVGPIARLQAMWRDLPTDPAERESARKGCQKMRDFVVRVREKLQPRFDNLTIRGSHKGSQPFVLWKNRQYAEHRLKFDREALEAQEGQAPEDETARDLWVPVDPAERAHYEAAFERFCAVFPDAFYISERGRDYLDKPRNEQERGRLLSAGFHSMMGYFRDDGPLYELILDPAEQRELDGLWQELDFVTSAPLRQYSGFLWFERTDSRFMRDPEFDFARAEDKDAATEPMIEKLAEVYLDKARRIGGGAIEIKAIEDFFRDINAQIRWVEQARLGAEPSHLDALLEFAARAYRRELSSREREDLVSFYRLLRGHDGLDHEEAIQDAIVSVLMSPRFCYRMDLAGSGEARSPLSDYELASRLSYFLWSSMPDQQLLDLAAAGDLHRPEVLVAQARRMLRDDRVRGLATEFASNWLDFRRFEQHNSVDRQRFPAFTDALRRAMFEEPIRFFVDLVQNDGSILDFLYADHTFVNSVLAEHYGMAPVLPKSSAPSGVSLDSETTGDPAGLDGRATEETWIRVDAAARHKRGGLLPMSVFLTKNAPGLRTSPVKRGYWVVRHLLGERIPPPPPNVPELPNDETKLGDQTLRDVLARHREHKSCAGCHERFDSIGLVFESFGPIGRWRDRDLGGRTVDPTATFPDGRPWKGLEGLKSYLRANRQDEYVANFCRKLLSYGLGRTLQLSDDPLIHEMRRQLAAEGHRFGVLVERIVTSPQFLNKRGHDPLVQD